MLPLFASPALLFVFAPTVAAATCLLPIVSSVARLLPVPVPAAAAAFSRRRQPDARVRRRSVLPAPAGSWSYAGPGRILNPSHHRAG